jgi:hypothetical protein
MPAAGLKIALVIAVILRLDLVLEFAEILSC